MSLVDFISSSLSTIIAEVTTIPICTVKTNYQTNMNHKSILDSFNHVKKRGIIGFYNASSAALSSQIVSTSSKFTFYSAIKRSRNTQEEDLKNNVINGTIGGILASFMTHPFDVIKVHHQNGLKIKNELQNNGLKMFYRGYSKSLTKSMIITSFLFPFYDFYKSKFDNIMIATTLSSLTMSLILQPFDLLKIRQISNKPLYIKRNSLIGYIKYFYRGYHINLMRIIPHFYLTMFLTEKIKSFFE